MDAKRKLNFLFFGIGYRLFVHDNKTRFIRRISAVSNAIQTKDNEANHLIIYCLNRPRSIYQYSGMAPRLSGQTSIFGVVFFVSKSLLGIERQKKL